MLRALGLGATLFGFWLLLSGHYTPLLIGLGVGSCALVVYVGHRMELLDREGVPLQVVGRFVLYFPWIMKEIFVANVRVAKVILNPGLPIAPRMFRTRATQETDLGRVIYANSITLTPGTVTTGVEGDVLEVHALTAGDVIEDGGGMDRRCTWVEGH